MTPMALDMSLFRLVSVKDPTGHTQPTLEVVYDPDGLDLHSGIFLVEHGWSESNPTGKLMLVQGNPAPSNAVLPYFEILTAAESVTVVAGKVLLREN